MRLALHFVEVERETFHIRVNQFMEWPYFQQVHKLSFLCFSVSECNCLRSVAFPYVVLCCVCVCCVYVFVVCVFIVYVFVVCYYYFSYVCCLS